MPAHITHARSWLLPGCTLLLGLCIGWYGHSHYSADDNMRALAANPVEITVATPSDWPQAAPANPTPPPLLPVGTASPQAAAAEQDLHNQLQHLSSAALADELAALRQRDDRQWQQAHNAFLVRLQQWTKSGQASRSREYAEAWLARVYFDADVMMALAQAQLVLQETDAALATLYTVLAHTDQSSGAEELRAQIHQLAEAHHQRLAAAQQWDTLAALYAFLVSAEPAYTPYFLRQAEVEAAREHYGEAYAALTRVYDDPALGDQARALAARIAHLQAGEVQIPLRTTHGNYALEASVADAVTVQLLIDTGASLSALSRASFEQLPDHSARFLDTVAVDTANGRVQAPRYRVNSLGLPGGVVARDVDVLVLDDLPAGQGLLGMNVLNQFDFEIDQNSRTLRLTPR